MLLIILALFYFPYKMRRIIAESTTRRTPTGTFVFWRMLCCTGDQSLGLMMRKKHEGMTLIELLMALSISIILVVVAVPMYQDYQRRSMYLDALIRAADLKLYVLEHYSVNGTWPVPQKLPNGIRMKPLLRQPTLGDHGEIFIALEPDQYVVFWPNVSQGRWQWECRASPNIVRFVPVPCDQDNESILVGADLLEQVHEWWNQAVPAHH
jgi:type II secretory pathway pseudopilin PulG